MAEGEPRLNSGAMIGARSVGRLRSRQLLERRLMALLLPTGGEILEPPNGEQTKERTGLAFFSQILLPNVATRRACSQSSTLLKSVSCSAHFLAAASSTQSRSIALMWW